MDEGQDSMNSMFGGNGRGKIRRIRRHIPREGAKNIISKLGIVRKHRMIACKIGHKEGKPSLIAILLVELDDVSLPSPLRISSNGILQTDKSHRTFLHRY